MDAYAFSSWPTELTALLDWSGVPLDMASLAALAAGLGSASGLRLYALVFVLGALGRFVLRDRVLALLEHLVDHGNDAGIVEDDALIDFFLLDRGEQQANGVAFSGFACAHGGFHVVVDALS